MVPPDVNVFGLQIGIAEQIPHAVGVAWGMKLRKTKAATLTLFGDGATSEGAFHEAINFAGVLHAPVVLVCQNNGWAISVPRSSQTASETLAQKAAAYGVPGRLVDGNDVLAMYREVGAALERARSGQGPTLIEAVTYRFGPHSTADDPKRYRSASELTEWQDTRDPLTRLRAYLEHEHLWDETKQTALEEEMRTAVATTVTAALTEPVPPPESMFEHVYATPSRLLAEQQHELLAFLKATEKGVTFP
jgi:pyruvate dehydrogenase E1 component alpha subunit